MFFIFLFLLFAKPNLLTSLQFNFCSFYSFKLNTQEQQEEEKEKGDNQKVQKLEKNSFTTLSCFI